MSRLLRILCRLFSVIFSAYLFLTVLMFEDDDTTLSSVIVLKLPRTGSTWFSELLNNFPSVYISKEIIQSVDSDRFSIQQKEQHLHLSLQKPKDKLSQTDKFLPTGRFIRDFLMHKTFKLLRSLKSIGFTVNPEHCKGVDWGKVVDGLDSVKLILFVRSNVVKTSISAIRGVMTKKLCGTSNVQSEDVACEKLLKGTRLDLSFDEFMKNLLFWQERFDSFYHLIQSDPVLQGLDLLTVYYEDLQTDLLSTMDKVARFLMPGRDIDKIPSYQHSDWTKRSPDDLSKVLTNFSMISERLDNKWCVCWHRQLVAKGSELFPENCSDRHDLKRCYRHAIYMQRNGKTI